MGDARRVVLLTAIHLGYRFLSLSRKVILYLLYEITPRLKKKSTSLLRQDVYNGCQNAQVNFPTSREITNLITRKHIVLFSLLIVP